MSEIKLLDETPAHRTRRVLTRLRLPGSSVVTWLGVFVGIAGVGLIVFGLFVGILASDVFQGHVDRLRELWMEP